MNSFRRFVEQYGIPGWALAIGIIIVGREPVWWGYKLLRHNSFADSHLSLIQAVCALYFSCFVWALVFLCANLRRYPGMTKDAVLGGALLGVAAVLRDADVSSLLSGKGFSAAFWVAFVATWGFLVRTSMSHPETQAQNRQGADDPK